MLKYRSLWQPIIAFCLISISFFPFIGLSNLGESGKPDGSGVTNVTWYVGDGDDVNYENKVFRTKDIQINNTGRMTWDNVSAYINGSVTVNSTAYFNLTDCLLNLSGNFSISGIVNFDNVTLIMNSSKDGEFGINVTTTGTFNVLNNSNITAYDITTPIDLFTNEPGNESWGLHYYFTVHGNLTLDHSYVSYTYGNLDYLGGIHLYETSDAIITNSTIYENEVTGIYAEGNTSHIIQNNTIYNATKYGIYLFDHANALVDNNTIETYLSNFGYGIVCLDWSHAKIYRNTIRNNRFDGILIGNYSNASIQLNTISNNERYGINISAFLRMNQATGQIISLGYCNPFIYQNDILNNREGGIYDIIGPAEIINNTISSSSKGSAIFIRSFQWDRTRGLALNVPGNITNNSIQYNGNHGINLSANYFSKPTTITMTIKNNNITNNNWSGINILGGTYQSNQFSPEPTIIQNNISNNNQSGVSNYRAVAYELTENVIEFNNRSGIFCEASSKPKIIDNQIGMNKKYGIETESSSNPKISYNDITKNEDSGIRLTGYTNQQVIENNLTENQGHGIEVSGSSSTPDINNNRIFNNNHSGVYGSGGNNNFIIRLNEIYNNSWSGIEGNSTNCRISNNEIWNNTQDGIKLTGSSPTINQNNRINYNGWNGLACYSSSQPALTNNKFMFNGKSGIYLHGSSPGMSVSSNELFIANNTENGVACEGGAKGTIKAAIWNNTLAGVFTAGTGTNVIFLNSEIYNNNQHGVNATDNSEPSFVNTTIYDNNTGEAFWLDGGADPVCISTTFTGSGVYFMDTASTLTVKWYVHIRTVSDATGNPVGNCQVRINSTTQPQDNPLWIGTSDVNGEISWLRITEYIAQDTGGDHRATGAERKIYTPNDISGETIHFRNTHVTPNPVLNSTQTVTLRLLPNHKPGTVTGITPGSTHNAHPTISWEPTTDPDAQTLRYRVWIGTALNTSNVFGSSLQTETSYTLTTDLDYATSSGNKTYHVTIVTNDGHGAESYALHKLYLLNHKPTIPEIALDVPEKPTILLGSVKCTITTPSTDPDGDEINYTYKWYKNGELQSGLTLTNTKNTEYTISVKDNDIEFQKGDEWEVKVYADDSLGFGRGSSQSAKFKIGNVGPEVATNINDIVMNEDTKKLAIIDLTKSFSDIDEIGALRYTIKVTDPNITVIQNSQTHKVDIIPAPNWNGWATINFTCFDAENRFATQLVKVTVMPVNDEPEFRSIGGVPWQPGSVISFTDDDSAFEDKWFNITISCSDIDVELGENDEVFIKVSDQEKVLLNTLNNNPLNFTLSFFPNNDDIGIYTFSISIKDKDLEKYKYETYIEIEVKNTNDKPTLVYIKKYEDDTEYEIPSDKILDLRNKITLKEDQELILEVIADDADLEYDEDILFFFTNTLDIIEVDSDTDDPHTCLIIITPGHYDIGLLQINITVKDQSMETDSVQITLFVENVNNAPFVSIEQPIQDKIYLPRDDIRFEATVTDFDMLYGDELTYLWVSDIDGELGNSQNIVIAGTNLTVGEHTITFSAYDKALESDIDTIKIIIGGIDTDSDNLPDDWERDKLDSVNKYIGTDDPDKDGYSNSEEYLLGSDPMDKNDPKKQGGSGEEQDLTVIGAILGFVIVIIIMLLVIFLVMRSLRTKTKGKDKGSKTAQDLKQPGKVPPTPGAPGGPSRDEEPTVLRLPTQYIPSGHGIPDIKPEPDHKPTPEGAGPSVQVGPVVGAGGPPVPLPTQIQAPTTTTPNMPIPPMQQQPGLPPFIPGQIMTCPKCNTPMTFTPSGEPFCINCGFKPDLKKMK